MLHGQRGGSQKDWTIWLDALRSRAISTPQRGKWVHERRLLFIYTIPSAIEGNGARPDTADEVDKRKQYLVPSESGFD